MGRHIGDPALQVAAARRVLARGGCGSRVAGQGAVGGADDPDTFWISPWGYFDETLPDHVVHVGMDLEVLSGAGGVSPAVGFHAEMLRDRPAANAVIHTHSPFVEVLSTTGVDMGMYSADACLFHDEQAHYFDDGVRPIVDGPRMSAALGERSVLWLGNHGVVIVAETLALATVKAITLESSARCHVEAQTVGGKEMPIAEAVRSKGLYLQNFIGAMWEANWRRLRRSDPDLFETLDG